MMFKAFKRWFWSIREPGLAFCGAMIGYPMFLSIALERAPCPRCLCPVYEGETPCPNCQQDLVWEYGE